MAFLAELKNYLESHIENPSRAVSFVYSPQSLIVYYRGAKVGAWLETQAGGRWDGAWDSDPDRQTVRDVYDGKDVTVRALFLFIRDSRSGART